MKSVLIAHQSTIPPYRVPFYNALETRRPPEWQFEVVYDPHTPAYFQDQNENAIEFQFSTLCVKTYTFMVGGKSIVFQDFFGRAAGYDLIIVENALNNLTYPLCQLHQITGKRIAFWGHGRDRNAIHPPLPKRLAESIKLFQSRLAHGFFAYSTGVREYLIGQGLPVDKIFVVNNTIDILKERDNYRQWIDHRDAVRESMGLAGKKVLLFVGRMRKDKRIDFLLDAFAELLQIDPTWQLLMVGAGGEEFKSRNYHGVSFLGSIVDPDRLGPIYIASDVYLIPAAVGLGPLQAFCYDLPTVTIHADNHGPEFEYLTPDNSVILPEESEPHEYAQAIHKIFSTPGHLEALRLSTWNSIQHLTIENMADRFIDGVNQILKVQ